MKRSGKFYRKNEREVMKALGLEPTKNSGSGWVEKEDGQSDKIICQLKSTDAMSISLKRADIDTLEHNAQVAHKVPLFALQFLQTNDIFLCMRPEDVFAVAAHLLGVDLDALPIVPDAAMPAMRSATEEAKENWARSMADTGATVMIQQPVVSSDAAAREAFNKYRNDMFNKSKGAL